MDRRHAVCKGEEVSLIMSQKVWGWVGNESAVNCPFAMRPKKKCVQGLSESAAQSKDLLALSLSRGDGPEHHTAGHDLGFATIIGGDIRLGWINDDVGV